MSTASTEPTVANKSCPYCGREILEKALKCRHCHRWLREQGPSVAGTVESGGYNRGQSPRHLVLLGLSTLGLYQFYWFYRNWRDLNDHVDVPVSPGWRTVGLLVPFLNVFLVYQQLRSIRDVSSGHGIAPPYSPAMMTAVFFLLAATANLAGLWVVSLLSVVPLLPVQQTLNVYWQGEQPGTRMREELNAYEIAAIIVGGLVTLRLLATGVP